LWPLVVLFGLAVLVRVKDLPQWMANPDFAIHQGQPLLTNYDGYYYLGLARDLLEHTYDPIDEKRATPDGYPRPWPPPLLSTLAAGMTRATGLPLLWLATLLPAVLGATIVVPVFLLGRRFGGDDAGAVAAILAGLAPYFLLRSSLGWFDTDCLNPTFALSLAYFALRIGETAPPHRYGHLLGFVLTFAGFFWWWDSTPETVSLLGFGTLCAAAAALYRPGRRGWLFLGGIVVCLAGGLVAWQGSGFVVQVFRRIPEYLGYVTKVEMGPFPNVGISLGEQASPGLGDLCVKAAGSIPGFVVGVVGLGWFTVRDFRRALVLTPLLVVGALSIAAERFIVFLSPLCVLGVGIIVARVLGHSPVHRTLASVGVIGLLIPPLVELADGTRWPSETPRLVAGLERIAADSAPGSVVWSHPDLGYLVGYFSRRATVGDGSVHEGDRMTFASFPYASKDGDEAADFIRSYVLRGAASMREVFLRGEQKEAHAFDSRSGNRDIRVPPAYFLVDWRMLKSVHWWYWFGTWDPVSREGQQPYREWHKGVQVLGDQITGENDWGVDLARGVLHKGDRTALLDRATIHTPEGRRRYDYHRPESLALRVYTAGELAIVWDTAVDRSLFARLFFDGEDPSGRFLRVDENVPVFRLFRVDAATQ
jgi:dolichyl-diphosphooligosaccharide--protein glycosyltransferase